MQQASLVAQTVKNLPAMQEIWVQSLGREDPLEKGMAGYNPWDCTESDTAEATQHTLRRQWDRQNWTIGRSLGYMGLQRIGHN